MPLTLTLNFPPVTFTIDDETMRSSLTITNSVQAAQAANAVQTKMPPPELPMEDKTEQLDQAETKPDPGVSSDEELLVLAKRVVDAPNLGFSHLKKIQDSLGKGGVSLWTPTQKAAFAVALRDALELRAAQ